MRQRSARQQPGQVELRYREPMKNGRGDLLSPKAEAKRKLRASLEAAAGRRLSPRQLKRARKALARETVRATNGGAA